MNGRHNRSKTPASWRRPLVILVALAILLAALMAPASLDAATNVYSSARSTAMGGAFTALAKGVNAPKYNPANLGLQGFGGLGVELVSVGASITNNSFSLTDYNEYTGAVLTTSDKQDILDKIPAEGLSVDADVRASALTVSLGRLAFSFNGVASVDINLNKDLVNLILNGNTFADTINVTGSYSEGVSYASFDVSYGFPIFTRGDRQLAVGLTAGYLRGIAIEEIVRLEGAATTFATGFSGAGEAVLRSATNGTGYKLDLGAALKLSKDYSAGVRFENVLSNISWNEDCEEHGYIFEFDSATVEDFDKDLVTSDEYTKDIPGFSTFLPAIMNVGLGNTTGRFLWALDWTQGFKRAPGSSTKPRLAAGVEYSLVGFLPLRTGFMTGGDRSSNFSFGGGLRFLGYYLDLAIVTGGSASVYSTKGANVSVSTGIQF